jgi:hypothetical protein
MFILIGMAVFLIVSMFIVYTSSFHDSYFYKRHPVIEEVCRKMQPLRKVGEALGIINLFVWFIFIGVVLTIPIMRYETRVFISEFKAIEQAINMSRESLDDTDIERTAIYLRVIEINQKLARFQHHAGSHAGIFYDNQVMELNFIE